MPTDLDIKGGLPYNRQIRIKGAANTWPTVNDFEVRSQIRVSQSPKATLKGSLTPYISRSVDGEDIVLNLIMSGAATRSLYGGYYDIIVSDPGTTDNRAIIAAEGKLTVTQVVTGA